jgi:regulator of cell morphogenesis and NO signaling
MVIQVSATTIGQLVRERPARSRVFEALKIDYCCGGKLPLEEVCRKKGLEPAEVLKLLNQCDAQADSREDNSPASLIDADAMTLTELADHIQQTHHAYLKSELPRLDLITEKVARVHGEHDPRLVDVRRAFEAFRDEVVPHMMKEEIVLFPIVRKMEQHRRSAGDQPLPEFHCGSVANPIRQMELEHDHAGQALERMRELTDGFQPPEWACNTYRAMLDALRVLERDMHHHVHKENNVLFPKAIEMEAG